jgi:hypothetical protein
MDSNSLAVDNLHNQHASSVSILLDMLAGNCDPERPDRLVAQADITANRIIMHAQYALTHLGGGQ